MGVVESLGNELIETTPTLVPAAPPNVFTYVQKEVLNGDVIEAIYFTNGYMLKRLYNSNRSEIDGYDRTDVQEFWNGAGGLALFMQPAVSQAWTKTWVRGGHEKFRLITEGHSYPGGL